MKKSRGAHLTSGDPSSPRQGATAGRHLSGDSLGFLVSCVSPSYSSEEQKERP